ncbi:MAG: gamma-glutamylcyclotransferase [Actinomycetota bacterium]|nr:gamma-glutamylcyclotransferase [Actinomycetota bacterium]
MDDTLPVFVYGTLLPGQWYWSRINRWVDRWEPAEVHGKLYDTGLGYPAAAFGPEGRIYGVLVHFRPGTHEAARDVIDEIEGEGTEYRRVEVETISGTKAAAYEWIRDPSALAQVMSPWRPIEQQVSDPDAANP